MRSGSAAFSDHGAVRDVRERLDVGVCELVGHLAPLGCALIALVVLGDCKSRRAEVLDQGTDEMSHYFGLRVTVRQGFVLLDILD